jgi:hypothetical protein
MPANGSSLMNCLFLILAKRIIIPRKSFDCVPAFLECLQHTEGRSRPVSALPINRELSDDKNILGTHPLEPVWGEFISIPNGAIGMATTCEDKLRIPVPSSAKKSFGVECGDWIKAHGAQRRDIAGGERDSGKYKGDASEGGHIVRRYAVEESGHEVRDDERTGHTQPGASGGQT